MVRATQSPAQILSGVERAQNESGLFSSESVLSILKLIFSGSPLAEVLTIIARLVESQSEGMLCTIWLPDEDGKYLHCAAAPSLPGFSARVGRMEVCPKGASCGTAVYRREPVYVADILTESIWDGYRDLVLPYGIRSVWSRPLFTSEGKSLGTFAILYREVRSPGTSDLHLIEEASHITGIAIERHMNEEALRHERDRLRLLLEITNSMTSRLDLRRLVEALSTNLLRVTRCDFCALLLPVADNGQLRVTTLYNPEARGSLCDGTLIPIHGSSCDKAFRTGKTQHFNHYEEVRDDPEYFGSNVGRPFYQRVMAEGLVSGCDLPLIGRGGVVGVLAALKRSERAYSKDDVAFLEQVAGQVAIAVENALDYENAVKDRDKETKRRLYLEEEIRSEFTEIIGESPALKTALSLASVVAPTDSTVLVLGETGTGKELVARAIHKLSSRSEKAFVKLNCAAIPLGLLESELFGHEKGAFTGAIGQKTGRLGAFREDLYYRMKVFPIRVPALRQRTEDIPKLVRHFTEVYARRMNKKIEEIPSETMDALVRYRWPGNVRELQNFIERAVILSPHTTLRAPTSELEPFHAPKESEIILTGLAQVERDHILRALEASNWVIAGPNGAAARLGMKRTSLVYRMKKLGISRPAALPQKHGVTGRAANG